jgi:mRNA deadenylase 3'-5' endonuclease subunit Ccr4
LVKSNIEAETELKNYGGIWGMVGYQKEVTSEWYEKISKRNNVLLCLTFINPSSKEEFTIANYHAPCAWKCQKSMCVVAACLLKALSNLKKSKLYLAGDFNIQPGSLPYQILTTGKLDTDDFDLLLIEGDIDDMNLTRLVSSYKIVYGEEPNVTIKSKTCMRGEINEFEGCLDYIFYLPNDDIYPVEATLTPVVDEELLLPSIEWPSDHKMLKVTFA